MWILFSCQRGERKTLNVTKPDGFLQENMWNQAGACEWNYWLDVLEVSFYNYHKSFTLHRFLLRPPSLPALTLFGHQKKKEFLPVFWLQTSFGRRIRNIQRNFCQIFSQESFHVASLPGPVPFWSHDMFPDMFPCVVSATASMRMAERGLNCKDSDIRRERWQLTDNI